MNSTKFILFFYFGLMLLCFLVPYVYEGFFGEEAYLNPYDYARITDVSYKGVLDPEGNGDITITERLTFDIHAASKSNLFWELWRELPESYIDGVHVSYDVLSVKQILSGGREIEFGKSPKLYWNDNDYIASNKTYGPNKWYYSRGPYNEYRRQYECVLLYVDGLYREKPTYEIEYIMHNASFHYNDCSELYLSLYSEETINHLNSYNAQILIPDEIMPSAGNYYVHTYGTNSNVFPFNESSTQNPGYHTFSFSLDKSDLKFRPYNEYIEFALVSYGEDKHIFTENAAINNYYRDNVLEEILEEQEKYDKVPMIYSSTKALLFILLLGCSILIYKAAKTTIETMKLKYTFYKPTMKMDYFRDIPSNLDPAFAATLAFCRDKKQKDSGDKYAAIILSLARKNYIELRKVNQNKNWLASNVEIAIKYKPQSVDNILPQEIDNLFKDTYEPLTLTEEYFFNLIVRYSYQDVLLMSKLQNKISTDYENTESFLSKIEKSTVDIGISQDYFQKSNYMEPSKKLKFHSNFYLILGILLITVFNFISYQTRLDLVFGGYTILGISFIIGAFRMRKASRELLLLTQFGEDEYVKWKGLYNFLSSETLMNERTIVELPLWEQYLVYATAFGISEHVINALKIRCPDYQESPVLGNTYFYSRSFHTHTHTFHSSVRSTSNAVRYGGGSGGYGGHGGYGGGGRGGGGGRRRSLKNTNKKRNELF